VPDLKKGQIALLENVRFLVGEEKNSDELAKKLAQLAEVFVMDAFAVAHRAQASTHGVAKYAPQAVAGPLLQKELQAIHAVLLQPKRPVVAIVGGSKVSSKLKLLTNLLEKVDVLVVGGGIANTFLAAKGFPMGDSLYEADLVPTGVGLLDKAKALGKTIWLPSDVVVGTGLTDDAKGTIKTCSQVNGTDKIFDIGPASQQDLAKCIAQAKTILWNGPVGVFECAPFAQGTKHLAEAIAANAQAFSVAGGGDTLAAIEQFHVQDKISYLSTGGGAFLEALEGKSLPAVAILETRLKEKATIQ
jgi:phosphoglycerate kinase